MAVILSPFNLNLGFWDPDGYYFNREGYDKHGGYYDDNHEYIPGQGWDYVNNCYPDENENEHLDAFYEDLEDDLGEDEFTHYDVNDDYGEFKDDDFDDENVKTYNNYNNHNYNQRNNRNYNNDQNNYSNNKFSENNLQVNKNSQEQKNEIAINEKPKLNLLGTLPKEENKVEAAPKKSKLHSLFDDDDKKPIKKEETKPNANTTTNTSNNKVVTTNVNITEPKTNIQGKVIINQNKSNEVKSKVQSTDKLQEEEKTNSVIVLFILTE